MNQVRAIPKNQMKTIFDAVAGIEPAFARLMRPVSSRYFTPQYKYTGLSNYCKALA